MSIQRNALIDNWSLELAGIALDAEGGSQELNESQFIQTLGGLSSFINAFLLYNDTHYILNGFEKDWTRLVGFQQNIQPLLKAANSSELNINWNSEESYADKGIMNYLQAAGQYQIDLFVSPERAEKMNLAHNKKSTTNIDEVFSQIDQKIKGEAQSIDFSTPRLGILHNFQVPSLTHYVLSQATNSNDLLQVLIQIKLDRKIEKALMQIDEIMTDTKKANNFQVHLDQLIHDAFGKKNATQSSFALQLSIFFLSISKNIDFNFFTRKTQVLFLKDLVQCRSEVRGLSKHIERLYGRKIG